MDTKYNSQLHEQAMYDLWDKSGGFNPDTTQIEDTAQKKPTTHPQTQTQVSHSENTKKIDTSIKNASKNTFTIAMPPPNANDPLHIGHAMFLALEDCMIRYHRMLGDDTLWIPGTDHAGIETQFVFEKKLKKIGKSRFDFDRQTLYQMIWEYVQENSNVAIDQMKKIGASADWSRFCFMLDPNYVDEVLTTFILLHDKKLIYRDLKLVNYSPSAGTSYSELEITYEERNSPLYYVRYYFVEKPTAPTKAIDANKAVANNETHADYVVVATTRPEPIFVDTHLAVHPDNPKTKHLIGKKVFNPLTNIPMEIIADSFVDPAFGTGIVKLTPAHDHADFDVAKRHNLPIIEAITTDGRITTTGGELAGLKVKAAREKAVEILTQKNCIEKVDLTYINRVSTDYKTGQPIEPMPLAQFFVQVKPLIEPIQKALDSKELLVHGAGHDKILAHWLDTLRDWNISRQIVWGIRIPVWYNIQENPDIQVTFIEKDSTKPLAGKIKDFLEQGYSIEHIKTGIQTLMAPKDAVYVVSKTSPGADFIQETDTFDTWFSSAQWPFATLRSLDAQANLADKANLDAQANRERSPKNHSNFDRFYPTQVMETGYDILPFWVMRMLLVGTFVTGKLPFNDVYLHGLVRDQQGKKMSKSKGNVINPLKIIEQYGADALRMALLIRSSAGLDKSIGDPDFKAMRNFTNKMWNAARFIQLLKTGEVFESKQSVDVQKITYSTADLAKNAQVFDEKLNSLVVQITKNLEEFRFGLAAETLHTEFWHWFCDEAIEEVKSGALPYSNLQNGLLVFLKLLHPFMPFVTEKIWQEIHQKQQQEQQNMHTPESTKSKSIDLETSDSPTSFASSTLLMLTAWPTSD